MWSRRNRGAGDSSAHYLIEWGIAASCTAFLTRKLHGAPLKLDFLVRKLVFLAWKLVFLAENPGFRDRDAAFESGISGLADKKSTFSYRLSAFSGKLVLLP